jgi:hypothetical protein
MSPEDFLPLSPQANILVVNSKGNLHSLRFSLETVLLLDEKNYNLNFIDLGSYDPEFSGAKRIKVLFRNILKKNSYQNIIYNKLNKEKINIIKPKTTLTFLFDIYFFSFLKIFISKKPRISNLEMIPINSWVSTRAGHTKFDWNLTNKYTAYQALVAIKKTKITLNNLLNKKEFSNIYTFNGRFPVDSTIVSICNSKQIPYFLYDGGSLANDNYNRIQYFKTSPHNYVEVKSKINSYWDNECESARKLIALNTLNDLTIGKRTLGSSFNWVEDSNLANFQTNWSETVVFYSSSDWEQGALSQWKPQSGFSNQFEAVEELYNACRELDLHLLIKTHPIKKNYKGKQSENSELLAWNKFAAGKKISLVWPGEYSSSPYQLLNKAKINVGFRTSLSAQAMYLQKKVIILTDTLWRSDELNSNYADSYLQIFNQLNHMLNISEVNYNLLPVYKWAYYQAVHGAKMRFSNFDSGKFQIL